MTCSDSTRSLSSTGTKWTIAPLHRSLLAHRSRDSSKPWESWQGRIYHAKLCVVRCASPHAVEERLITACKTPPRARKSLRRCCGRRKRRLLRETTSCVLPAEASVPTPNTMVGCTSNQQIVHNEAQPIAGEGRQQRVERVAEQQIPEVVGQHVSCWVGEHVSLVTLSGMFEDRS